MKSGGTRDGGGGGGGGGGLVGAMPGVHGHFRRNATREVEGGGLIGG